MIESLSDDGRGVARIEGKTIFIRGALPGEMVRFMTTQSRRAFDEGVALELLSDPHPQRVTPPCEHALVCGGCRMQHLHLDEQLQHKAQVLEQQLTHFGKVSPERFLPPIASASTGYRYKARLGVRYVPKKGGVLVGFRELASNKVAEINHCAILHPTIGDAIPELKRVIEQLSVKDKVPQVEVAMADTEGALVFRHMAPLTEADWPILQAFHEKTGLQLWGQPKGPDSLVPWFPAEPKPLTYEAEGCHFTFEPLNFTQINPAMNQAMLQQALELLALSPTDRVLDLFCGLGNFTLPMAKHAGHVTGVEADSALIERAQSNARANDLAEKTEFVVGDLYASIDDAPWAHRTYDKVLLDPPRSGAEAIVRSMERFSPDVILYVSCNPSTLARDAGILVHEKGYVLEVAGAMDMFPHTAHVESMALFRRADKKP